MLFLPFKKCLYHVFLSIAKQSVVPCSTLQNIIVFFFVTPMYILCTLSFFHPTTFFFSFTLVTKVCIFCMFFSSLSNTFFFLKMQTLCLFFLKGYTILFHRANLSQRLSEIQIYRGVGYRRGNACIVCYFLPQRHKMLIHVFTLFYNSSFCFLNLFYIINLVYSPSFAPQHLCQNFFYIYIYIYICLFLIVKRRVYLSSNCTKLSFTKQNVSLSFTSQHLLFLFVFNKKAVHLFINMQDLRKSTEVCCVHRHRHAHSPFT